MEIILEFESIDYPSRDNLSFDSKDWIRKDTKIDIVLKVIIDYHQE